MTRNEIITSLFNSKDFNDCINARCPPHLKDDLKAEIALLLCEKDEKTVIALHEKQQLNFFIARIILNQLSETGPFYKKYRKIVCIAPFDTYEEGWYRGLGSFAKSKLKPSILAKAKIKQGTTMNFFDEIFSKGQLSDSDMEIKERLQKENFEDKVMQCVEELHWYKSELFKLYINLGTFRAVSKVTRIPFTSIHLTLKEAAREIKEKLCQLK